ncbi:hypothetical protein [Putridiphycobacter roseus]|nr:hypothetical protein [Putridiphycobacter roseus]
MDLVKSDESAMQEIAYLNVFSLSIPNYFIEMDDINAQAAIQYGYIEPKDSLESKQESDEFYLTVIPYAKTAFAETMVDSGKVDLSALNLRTAINLALILEDFSAEKENPVTEMVNGIPTIKNSFLGRLGSYLVYYQMAVYETEDTFYQLLTWCMQNDQGKHKEEMNMMIASFEIK